MPIKSELALTPITFNLTGGVDELSAVTHVPFTSFLLLNNWRISEDGNRIEKRGGISDVEHTAFGGHDVFGYHTYYNVTPAFCQVGFAEDKVYRKEGSGSWTAIKTWMDIDVTPSVAKNMAHPVKMLDIQDMQFCITEVENFKILSTAGAAVVDVGIAAPTTVPTIAASYAATVLDEACAAVGTWTDWDAGAGAWTQVAYDSQTTFRFLTTGTAGDRSGCMKSLTGLGAEFALEIKIYPHLLGTYQLSGQFEIDIHNGRTQTQIIIDVNDVYIHSGVTYVSCGVPIFLDKWQTFKFYVNTSVVGDEYVEVYKDGIPFGTYKAGLNRGTTQTDVWIGLHGISTVTDVYLDYIKIGGTTGGNVLGQVRYAMTYARSGDYGHESNPIYGLVGAASFTGSGLNDMTTGGTYTGDETRIFRVKIDATGPPNTLAWSRDEGQTWFSTGIPLASIVYLPFGVELNFAALTGHTLNDYWAFTCYAMSADTIRQMVTLSSIPVSLDAQVDQRKIYRTMAGGSDYYLLAIINDNTTTSFVDNIPSEVLAYGAALREDRDVPPRGKFSVWWDDRLWIGVDTENMLYYSEIDEPESFYLAERWVSVKSGEAQDKLTGIIPYKGDLYFFKRNAIGMVRKRDDGTYARYWICREYGNIAPFSLMDCGGLLTFLSHRGWEVFNGCVSYSILFSRPIKATLDTANTLYPELICGGMNKKHYEAWLSIPDRTSGSAVVAVVNYTTGAFYTFSFAKTLSYVGEARDTNGAIKTYVGTRDGYACLAESGTSDVGTAVTATARSPWIRFPMKYNVRRAEYEIEAPTGITLSIEYYVNMEQAAAATRTIAGSTPTSTDVAYRLPIFDFEELDLNAQYFSMKMTNAEAVGASLKVNSIGFYYRPLTMKNRIAGN